MHRTRPKRENVLQRVFSIVDSKVNAFMPVFEQQFAAVFKIAIRDIDERLSEIRQRKQQFLLDALPVAIGDFVNAALRIELVREEPFFMAELFGEERINERDVVVHTPRFEDLFTAESQAEIPFAFRNVVVALFIVLAELATVPAIFNVFPQLKSQPVWI